MESIWQHVPPHLPTRKQLSAGNGASQKRDSHECSFLCDTLSLPRSFIFKPRRVKRTPKAWFLVFPHVASERRPYIHFVYFICCFRKAYSVLGSEIGAGMQIAQEGHSPAFVEQNGDDQTHSHEVTNLSFFWIKLGLIR